MALLTPFFRSAYIADLRSTLDHIARIHAMGFRPEAVLLSCCFIESLGHDITGKRGPSRNFAAALNRSSNQRFWRAVHTVQLNAKIAALKHPVPVRRFRAWRFFGAPYIRSQLKRSLGVTVLPRS